MPSFSNDYIHLESNLKTDLSGTSKNKSLMPQFDHFSPGPTPQSLASLSPTSPLPRRFTRSNFRQPPNQNDYSLE